jgi:RimJ/RimL family protein N-acetyltransferase
MTGRQRSLQIEERGLRRIISTAAPDNHASRHVMERSG